MLGVDTCGPSGSVALGRISAESVQILGQRELAGRTYSATLISAVGGLLADHGASLGTVGVIVAVYGPGSFTGVRVGLSAVKGLSEPAAIPVAPVSRLDVLARKAGAKSAALDAHRHEVFLRICDNHSAARELLAGIEELKAIEMRPGSIAVCDDGSDAVLEVAWPGVELARVSAPTAADAIRCAMPAIFKGEFVDLALLDGHYLRRSDAEIFGESPSTPLKADNARAQAVVIRAMRDADIEQVREIAASEREAPQWPRSAYQAAVKPEMERRIALVAEDAATGVLAGFAVLNMIPPEAELESIVTAVEFQRRGIARRLFGSLASESGIAGVKKIVLEVRESNRRARALYEALGFAVSGRRPRYYADPVEDAVLMGLDLGHSRQG